MTISIEKLAHVAIAVRCLDDHIPYYRDVLGLPLVGIEEVADQKVKVALFRVGQTNIELLEPSSDDSPIARYLEKRGEGIHHLAYGVDHLAGTLDHLAEKGIRLLDTAPRPGAHGAQIAFAHPRSTGGILTEFCQPGDEESES